MVNQKLVDWIKNGEAKGYSLNELRTLLVKQGHQKSDIEAAILVASNKSAVKKIVPVATVKPQNKKVEPKIEKSKPKIESTNLGKKPINFVPFIIAGSILVGIALIVAIIFLFPQNSTEVEDKPEELYNGCGDFSKKIKICMPFNCTFEHPFSNEIMERQIIGLSDGKCVYTETLPNGGVVDCNYTENVRMAVAEYYEDLEDEGKFKFNFLSKLRGDDDDKSSKRYVIEGKEVLNPLQEASERQECVVSGYGETNQNELCPNGEKYEGETYTYENGIQFVHIICSETSLPLQPNGGYAALYSDTTVEA